MHTGLAGQISARATSIKRGFFFGEFVSADMRPTLMDLCAFNRPDHIRRAQRWLYNLVLSFGTGWPTVFYKQKKSSRLRNLILVYE